MKPSEVSKECVWIQIGILLLCCVLKDCSQKVDHYPLCDDCLFSVMCALIDVMCIFIYINIIQSINDINILLKK